MSNVNETIDSIRKTDRATIATRLRQAGHNDAADVVEGKTLADRVGQPAGAPGTPHPTEAPELAEGQAWLDDLRQRQG